MRSAVRGIVIGAVLLALFGAIASRAGWIEASPPRPSGTGAWMLARASGLLAYAALSLDVIAGLLVSTRRADHLIPRGQLVDVHGWLSPIALGLVGFHGLVLLADRYAGFDILDLLVPFASSRWASAIGIGILAAYLMVVVHVSFGLRKKIGTVTWRRVHYLSFASFVLVTAHALAAGTDRTNAWFVTVYVVIGLAVASLIGIRIARARRIG